LYAQLANFVGFGVVSLYAELPSVSLFALFKRNQPLIDAWNKQTCSATIDIFFKQEATRPSSWSTDWNFSMIGHSFTILPCTRKAAGLGCCINIWEGNPASMLLQYSQNHHWRKFSDVYSHCLDDDVTIWTRKDSRDE
jgi:hypothetical protein